MASSNDPKPQAEPQPRPTQSEAQAAPAETTDAAASPLPDATLAHSSDGRRDIERAVRQAVHERAGGTGPGAGGPPVAASIAGHPFLGGIAENLPEFVALVGRVIDLLRQGGAPKPAP
jgi:hypothetical protein